MRAYTLGVSNSNCISESSWYASHTNIHRFALQAHLAKIPGTDDFVAVVHLEGQSFLYNQIRKMIGEASGRIVRV